LGIFGAGLSIPLLFSSREGLPWVKRGGKLTEYSRGVVHGMHLSGVTVTWIAERMGMTPSGVRRSLTISQGIAEGTRGETVVTTIKLKLN
jgi:hypothetical protein